MYRRRTTGRFLHSQCVKWTQSVNRRLCMPVYWNPYVWVHLQKLGLIHFRQMGQTVHRICTVCICTFICVSIISFHGQRMTFQIYAGVEAGSYDQAMPGDLISLIDGPHRNLYWERSAFHRQCTEPRNRNRVFTGDLYDNSFQ